jgi:hypothetical protein
VLSVDDGADIADSLWNDLMRTRSMSLLCGYRMNAAQLASNAGALFCAAHAG